MDSTPEPEVGGPKGNTQAGSPAQWDQNMLMGNLLERLAELAAAEHGLRLSARRIRFQLEQDAACQDRIRRWPDISGLERVSGFKELLAHGLRVCSEVLPVCLSCGECCRKGSPTLHLDDLPLVREEKLPWDRLLTLRKGEPVRVPGKQEPVFLPEERIKLREKPDATECHFLDPETDLCLIHEDRPLQCRAQSCWDPQETLSLAEEPLLTRRQLFEGVAPLLKIIEEHERRSPFEELRKAMEQLQDKPRENLDKVLDQLAFEHHYRHFIAEQLRLPENTLDLLFGRSFIALMSLFGLRVERKPDGSLFLHPEDEQN